jgi:tripartite-type tricarboxylate transporter receptor subunit TctC
MDAKKKKFLADILGEEEAERVIAGAATLTKELEEEGVSFKTKDAGPLAGYLEDLRVLATGKAHAVKELDGLVKELKESPHPAAPWVIDLLQGRFVRQGG